MTQGFTAQANETLFRITEMKMSSANATQVEYFKSEIKHLERKEATLLKQIVALAHTIETKDAVDSARELLESLEKQAAEAEDRFIETFAEERRDWNQEMAERCPEFFPGLSQEGEIVEAGTSEEVAALCKEVWPEEKLEAVDF